MNFRTRGVQAVFIIRPSGPRASFNTPQQLLSPRLIHLVLGRRWFSLALAVYYSTLLESRRAVGLTPFAAPGTPAGRMGSVDVGCGETDRVRRTPKD
jgi:hypothetical protein